MGRFPPLHTAAGKASTQARAHGRGSPSGPASGAPRTAKLELLGRSLDELAELCARERSEGVMRLLHHLVPEYQHDPVRYRAFF